MSKCASDVLPPWRHRLTLPVSPTRLLTVQSVWTADLRQTHRNPEEVSRLDPINALTGN
jgi:hypothetical protein